MRNKKIIFTICFAFIVFIAFVSCKQQQIALSDESKIHNNDTALTEIQTNEETSQIFSVDNEPATEVNYAIETNPFSTSIGALKQSDLKQRIKENNIYLSPIKEIVLGKTVSVSQYTDKWVSYSEYLPKEDELYGDWNYSIRLSMIDEIADDDITVSIFYNSSGGELAGTLVIGYEKVYTDSNIFKTESENGKLLYKHLINDNIRVSISVPPSCPFAEKVAADLVDYSIELKKEIEQIK